MNLRAIANTYTSNINPNIPSKLLANDGFATDDTGRRVPKFTSYDVTVQAQSLSTQERQEFNDGQLQQGQFLSVYVTGQFHALRRHDAKGSDMLEFPAPGETSATKWLVKSVAESWPDWCKVVVWRQL